MMKARRQAWTGTALWLCCVAAAAQAVDPYMGDWAGSRRFGDDVLPLAAQVIALGDGQYRAVFRPALYTADTSLAVLEGRVRGDAVVFGGAAARLAAAGFVGALPDAPAVAFEMVPERRESPTLGAAAPADAIVLFNGGNLDAWRQAEQPYGIVNLNQVLGSAQGCAGYLRQEIRSDVARAVRLEIGSDDGVKVWLNGDVIHANNALRPLTPGQDTVEAALRAGWNALLVKVSQGGGDWAAHLRVTGLDGQPIEGLELRHPATAADGTPLPGLGARVRGTVLAWEACGPYRQEGLGVENLLDTPFAPETAPDTVPWQRLSGTEPAQRTRWQLLEDGAMEIVPKSGSLTSKEVFGDHRLHLEFRTPFMPKARGQGRGNSGVYLQGRYEVQILDSYGLEGLDNECGGIYKVARPRLNMCAPPLQWQTYDIDFRAPRFDAAGRKTADAHVTVRHNGVIIHEDLALPGPTGGGAAANLHQPGPLVLQDHNDRVQFRNLWVVRTDP